MEQKHFQESISPSDFFVFGKSIILFCKFQVVLLSFLLALIGTLLLELFSCIDPSETEKFGRKSLAILNNIIEDWILTSYRWSTWETKRWCSSTLARENYTLLNQLLPPTPTKLLQWRWTTQNLEDFLNFLQLRLTRRGENQHHLVSTNGGNNSDWMIRLLAIKLKLISWINIPKCTCHNSC